MENTFFNTCVVVFKSSPWSQATDGTLYSKVEADKVVEDQNAASAKFLYASNKLSELVAITLDDYIDNCKREERNEGWSSGHESGYQSGQESMQGNE